MQIATGEHSNYLYTYITSILLVIAYVAMATRIYMPKFLPT